MCPWCPLWLIGVAMVTLILALNAQTIAIASIHVYQRHLSPVASAAGFRCRFTPTCSRYAEVVITRHGVVRGGWRTIKRVARCGPWTAAGTLDEP